MGAKISTIENLVPPMNVRGVRSFLGHVGFYRMFIKDFSKIVRPLCRLLEKDATFVFDEACLGSFMEIKKRLISALIMSSPNWSLPFEIMCDTNDCTIRAVLVQHHDKIFRAIHYARRTLNETQENHTTTEKEMLAIVYSYDKFRQYIIGSIMIVHMDHVTIQNLMQILESFVGYCSSKSLTWRSGINGCVENVVADHLFRLEAEKGIEDVTSRAPVPDPTQRPNRIQNAVLFSNPIPFSSVSKTHFQYLFCKGYLSL